MLAELANIINLVEVWIIRKNEITKIYENHATMIEVEFINRTIIGRSS